jgi:hypothetical protein
VGKYCLQHALPWAAEDKNGIWACTDLGFHPGPSLCWSNDLGHVT